jgi:hypothetical protein
VAPAAWPLQGSDTADGSPPSAVRALLLSLALLALQLVAMLLPILVSLASAFVEGRKDVVMGWLRVTFVTRRGFDTTFTGEHLYQFLAAALDVTQPSTLRQIALLAATVGVLMLWDRLRTLGRLWQTALVVLVAVDLIAFGREFHPTMPLADLKAPSGVAAYLASSPGLYRVYSQKGSRDEPNRLMAYDVAEANGYSSLEPDRHQRFAGKVEYAPNRLLDLLNARYYAVKNRYLAKPSFNLTSYDSTHPLLSSTGRNGASVASFVVEDAPADTLRVISTMRWASAVLQGEPVARITITDAAGRQSSHQLLAGVHTAEWALERPDLRGTSPSLGWAAAPWCAASRCGFCIRWHR